MTDLEMTQLCAQAMGITILPEWTCCSSRAKACELSCQHAAKKGASSCEPLSGECALAELNQSVERVQGISYNPLRNDEQAMALLKKFYLRVHDIREEPGHWHVAMSAPVIGVLFASDAKDLNRAIVECAAKMQAAK